MTKRITLALAMIGLSATAFAGTMGNPVAVPAGINLIAPDSMGQWTFGIEGLWVVNSGQDFQYASTFSTPSAGVLNNKNRTVEGDNDWGISANIGYMFAGNSRDVNLSYTGVFLNDSDSTNGLNNIRGVFGEVPPGLAGGYDRATGSSDQDLNRGDLTFGQLISIGDRVDLHPFGGVSYAHIQADNKANYFEDVLGTSTQTGSFRGNSTYWGVGPTAGIDTAVHLGGGFMNNMFEGFSIVGRVSGALYVGDMNANYSVANAAGLGVATASFKNEENVAVVPELDARIGLDYGYAFNPATSMNVQIGYEVANYFNAISQDAASSAAVNSVNGNSDFNYQGPYLRLQLNVA